MGIIRVAIQKTELGGKLNGPYRCPDFPAKRSGTGISDNFPRSCCIHKARRLGAEPADDFPCAQAASRTGFYPSPALQLGVRLLRCLGLSCPRRKRGPGSGCTWVGNLIVLDPRTSMHLPRPRTVSVLEGWEEGGISRRKTGPNRTYELSRGH